MRWLLLLLVSVRLAHADDRPAGDFDYYVLSLSWSPNWCLLQGDAQDAPQCDQPLGWVLHGLWPQYEIGWPDYCHNRYAIPTKAQTAAMADIMGASGAAWYQWRKHGACSGLPPDKYYDLARAAFRKIAKPDLLNDLPRAVTLPASLIEEAFLNANAGLHRDAITITCRADHIQEARICLTRDLEFRRCGRDSITDCSAERAYFAPIRQK